MSHLPRSQTHRINACYPPCICRSMFGNHSHRQTRHLDLEGQIFSKHLSQGFMGLIIKVGMGFDRVGCFQNIQS
jgi:hypothetical protein